MTTRLALSDPPPLSMTCSRAAPGSSTKRTSQNAGVLSAVFARSNAASRTTEARSRASARTLATAPSTSENTSPRTSTSGPTSRHAHTVPVSWQTGTRSRAAMRAFSTSWSRTTRPRG